MKIMGILVEYFLAVEMYFCRDYTWKTFVFESLFVEKKVLKLVGDSD